MSNLGLVGATNVAATISSLTPGVTVLTPNPRMYGTIAQNATATNVVPFTFSLSPGVTCGANADFALAVNFSGGAPGASPRVIRFRIPTGMISDRVAIWTALRQPPSQTASS